MTYTSPRTWSASEGFQFSLSFPQTRLTQLWYDADNTEFSKGRSDWRLSRVVLLVMTLYGGTLDMDQDIEINWDCCPECDEQPK